MATSARYYFSRNHPVSPTKLLLFRDKPFQLLSLIHMAQHLQLEPNPQILDQLNQTWSDYMTKYMYMFNLWEKTFNKKYKGFLFFKSLIKLRYKKVHSFWAGSPLLDFLATSAL